MDGGDTTTLLLENEAKASATPKRRTTATRRAPTSKLAGNVMYLPAARKRPAKKAPPVEAVPAPPPVVQAAPLPDVLDDDPFTPLPPGVVLLRTQPPPAPPLADPFADFEDVPPPVKAPPVINAAPETKPARKRDAAGRFIPSDDGKPRRSRQRIARQAAPVIEAPAQTILPPVVEPAPLVQPRWKFWQRITWEMIGLGVLWCFAACCILTALAFFLWLYGGIVHSIIFGSMRYEYDEPLWHWFLCGAIAIFATPLIAVAGLLHMDGQLTGAISSPYSPMGTILRGGAAPDQQYQSTQNGSSQFALYPGVQQSGIWQP